MANRYRRATIIAALPLCWLGLSSWTLAQTTPTATLTATCTAPCNAPATITLSATATVASGRAVSKIEFYDGATKLATDTSPPYSTTVTSVAGGSHSYTAKAYDNAATPLVGTSTAKVIAVNTAPTVSLAAACGTSPCTSPASVTLTATPADADNAISKVEFYRGSTLIATKVAAPWTFVDAALTVGSWNYTAKAFDSAATPLSTTSTAQTVTVVASVTAPTVTLTATCTAPCNAPATVTLSAVATVSSGRAVSKIEFYDGLTLLATDTSAPYSNTRTSVVGGSHAFTAKVYDNGATPLTATSAATTVAVNSAPAVSLTANCSASPCSAPATVTLVATPTDTDGQISKVEFYRGTTLLSTVTTSPWSYVSTGIAAGTYSFTAKAFDSASTPLATTSASRSVTVSAATTVTYTLAIDGPGVAVSLPGTLTPQLKFTAQDGDVLSLRVLNNQTGMVTQGTLSFPANSAPFLDTAPGNTVTLLYGPTGSLSNSSYVDLRVLADGEYVVKLVQYGSTPQSLTFSLIRAAPPVVAQPDTPSVMAVNSRAGQPVQFQFTSASGLPHFACELADAPGWRDAAGAPLTDNPSYFADVRIFAPSKRLLYASIGSDCFDGGIAYFSAAEPGTYTMVITPTGPYLGGRSLALATPQSGSTLTVDASPTTWTPLRSPTDGVRYVFPVTAGHTYTLAMRNADPLGAYRSASLHIEGIDSSTYYPATDTGQASSVSFVATASGVIAVSLLCGGCGTAPFIVSVVKDFAPSVNFADAAATAMYRGVDYYNGVTVSGKGSVKVRSILVWGYRTGWTPSYGQIAAAEDSDLPSLAFIWPAASREYVYYDYPMTIFAEVNFSNGVTLRTPQLSLTYQSPPAMVVDPIGLGIGGTVDDDQLSFRGIALTGTSNTTVFINDIRVPTVGAELFAQNNVGGGQFAVNNVPLVPGANTINITTHQPSGTRNYAYTVNRAIAGTAKNFSAVVQPDQGDAPLTSTVTVSNLTGIPWQRVELNVPFAADPIVLFPSNGAVVSYSFTVSGLGVRRLGVVVPIAITVFGPGDQKLFQTRRYVSVVSPSDSVSAAASAFAHVQTNLIAGNAIGAAQAVTDESLTKFNPLFQALGSSLSSFGALGSVVSWSVSGERVELVLQRGSKLFRAILMRDRIDGLWRIEDM